MNKKRVAIATTDGKNVNEHFGRAAFFRIYDIADSVITFVEARDVIAACQHKLSHNTTDFDRVIELLNDCDAVVVSKIGLGAADYLIKKGVRVFEAEGNIDAVINEIYQEKVSL